jgi:thymidylate synthase (FAD)
MKVELLENTQDDTFIANVARVSFDKWSTEPQERDAGLIKYLATHKHISPFFHVRFTFLLEESTIDFKSIADPTLLRGAVWDFDELTETVLFRTSYYGWIRLIKSGYLDSCASRSIAKLLLTKDNLKFSNEAYNLAESMGLLLPTQREITSMDSAYIPNPKYPLTAEMVDVSLRITCAIPVARQLFTHRMFDTNEISRRYVSTSPTVHLFDTLRSKPEGNVKQGSTGIHPNSAMWIHTIKDKYAEDLALYDNLIADGVAPEQARFVLPQAMETSIIFTGSLASWAKLVVSRTDLHAQLEIQDVANDIHHVLSIDPRYSELYLDQINSILS